MASLLVDAIRCVTETDEIGSDDVYLVTFRGNTKAPFDSNVGVHGPGSLWTDFDSGDLEPVDVTIANFRSDAVYVVMLVERDNAKDIDDAHLSQLRSQCDLVWKAQMFSLLGGGSGPATEAQRAAAAQKIADALLGWGTIFTSFPIGNDEIIDTPKRIVIKPGQLVKQEFFGDGGHYRIAFKVA